MSITKKTVKVIELDGVTKSNMKKNEHIIEIVKKVIKGVAYFDHSDKYTMVRKSNGGDILYELTFKTSKNQKEVITEFYSMGAKKST